MRSTEVSSAEVVVHTAEQDTNAPQIAKRFYAADVPNLLEQSGLRAELVHSIAQFRRNIHILHTCRNAFRRLPIAERLTVLQASMERMLPISHQTLYRQQVGEKEYTLPDDEYFSIIPPEAMARVLKSLKGYDQRRQELWPVLLFDTERTPLPNQAYSNEEYAHLAQTIYSQLQALKIEFGLAIAQQQTSVSRNQRIVQWQDRVTAEQVHLFESMVHHDAEVVSNNQTERTNDQLDVLGKACMQTSIQPLINEIQSWLELYMQHTTDELTELLAQKIGETSKTDAKIEYIMANDLADRELDIAYMLLPRELREVLLRLYGVTRLVKPSNVGASGYQTAQELYSLAGIFRALTPSQD